MINRIQGREFVAECTVCEHEEYGGCTDDIQEFIDCLNQKGWRIRKDGDDWIHECPSCWANPKRPSIGV